jgi:hypothetical protein
MLTALGTEDIIFWMLIEPAMEVIIIHPGFHSEIRIITYREVIVSRSLIA